MDQIDWRDKATYDHHLLENYLRPLTALYESEGKVSEADQRSVLNSLHWYFTLDRQARAPTVVVTETMAAVFHDLISQIMRYIDVETIASFVNPSVDAEIKHALLSYKDMRCHSPITIDAWDRDQGLTRLTYFLHGDKPTEDFLIDGKRVSPAYAKYRACNYFRRTLFRERIVWLPVTNHKHIEVWLDGKPTEIALASKSLIADEKAEIIPFLLDEAREAFFKDGRKSLPLNLTGLKALLLRWLANLPPVRKQFKNSWVLTDRESDAGDNAEELYRWIRINYPDINIWFLLSKESADYTRLTREGFKLVDKGITRSLLLANCTHLISSHAEHSTASYQRCALGLLMNCKYIFIPHGISKDDVSHWLNPLKFDLISSTNKPEYNSFTDNNTPYIYTTKEIKLTGFPRQDRIYKISNNTQAEDVRLILIMPTWRAGLSKNTSNIQNTQYIKYWHNLLNNNTLHELASKNNLTITYMPHKNTLPFIKHLSPPKSISIEKEFSKKALCQSILLITDYSSVAFEIAALRRPTIYYQFDFDSFYSGDHNWRQGYFNYKEDGFGPVVTNEEDLIYQIKAFLEDRTSFLSSYLPRMERAMPPPDGKSCERVFNAIIELHKPFQLTQHSL